MRSLVVAQDYPWPATSGSFLRLGAVVAALGDLGEVDLFAAVFDRRDAAIDPPPTEAVTRYATAAYPVADYSLRRRMAWVKGSLPLELEAQRFDGPRRQLHRFAQGRYDLAWYSKAGTWIGLGRADARATVVDLDDLEDRKVLARLQAGDLAEPGVSSRRVSAHLVAARAQARLNARRWGRLQRRIAADTDAVIVCSELDALRLGCSNACVVPNGYDAPVDPAGRTAVRRPPTVLFQGVLHYGPNADAVRWLVGSIGPRLRELVPDVRIRLVGAPDTPIRRLHDPPRVTVVGQVPDMVPELACADLAVIPIRFGSGTRVKALEAFAHRIPVVSTTIGAEGLNVRHGEHLLLADDAESFAGACARLLVEEALRTHLVVAASELLQSNHQWAVAQGKVVELVERLVGPS